MSGNITLDQQRLLSVLASLSGNAWYHGDPDDPSGTVNPKGPGGPVMSFGQVLTRQFIQMVVSSEQAQALREGTFTAEASRGVIEQFVDEFCGTKWPRPFPFPIPFPWPPFPWPPFPWSPFPFPLPDPEPEPRPIDLVGAGIEFHMAAQALKETELGAVFDQAAARFMDAAFG